MTDLAGELATDASSWMVLACYLDAAAWIGWPAQWPPASRVPGTDFGRVAAAAVDASRQGLPGTRDVRAAVVLAEAARWLNDSRPASDDVIHALTNDAAGLLSTAAVYVSALCPVADQATALDLLDPIPWQAHQQRRRWLRRHRRDDPPVLDPVGWQRSLWWRRATDPARDVGTVALVHAAAGIAAAIWSWPGVVGDPIGIRQELRDRVVRARVWVASGDLGA